MRNHFPIAVAVGLATLPALATAQQAPNVQPSSQLGIYVGLGAGVARASFDSTDFAPPAGTARSEKQNEAGGKGYVGWRLHRHLAVEGGYHNFGKFEAEYAGAGLFGKTEHKIDGWGLSAVGIAPFTPNFSAFGKVGAFNAKMETRLSGTVPANLVATSDRTTNLLIGAGVQYDFNNRFAVRGEYENFGKVGNSLTGQLRTDLWSASAIFKF